MNALEELCRIPLDDTSPTPLYQQLKQRLLQLIAIGRVPRRNSASHRAADLRSAGAFARHRAALLSRLGGPGHVTRRRGKGTFPVATSAEGIDVMIGFSDEMAHAGKTPSSRLINFRKSRAASSFARSP